MSESDSSYTVINSRENWTWSYGCATHAGKQNGHYILPVGTINKKSGPNDPAWQLHQLTYNSFDCTVNILCFLLRALKRYFVTLIDQFSNVIHVFYHCHGFSLPYFLFYHHKWGNSCLYWIPLTQNA